MPAILQWIITNKEWLFSGVGGVIVLGIVGFVFRRIFRTFKILPQVPAAAPIQISVNQHQTVDSSNRAAVRTESETTNPEIVSLPPRVCFVDGDLEQDGFIEAGNASRAAVATFRLAYTKHRGDLNITARISYWNIAETKAEMRQLVRVNHGAWLDEEFNAVQMTLTNTKELILAVQWEDQCKVVHDNRHGVQNNRGFSFYSFPPDCDQFFATVQLVDEQYGPICYDAFRIRRDPFEITRIPVSEVPSRI
jgi:hypothetical protein